MKVIINNINIYHVHDNVNTQFSTRMYNQKDHMSEGVVEHDLSRPIILTEDEQPVEHPLIAQLQERILQNARQLQNLMENMSGEGK